jgi:hypothetical protein
LAGCKLFSIEISKGYGVAEWREDLKKARTSACWMAVAALLRLRMLLH